MPSDSTMLRQEMIALLGRIVGEGPLAPELQSQALGMFATILQQPGGVGVETNGVAGGVPTARSPRDHRRSTGSHRGWDSSGSCMFTGSANMTEASRQPGGTPFNPSSPPRSVQRPRWQSTGSALEQPREPRTRRHGGRPAESAVRRASPSWSKLRLQAAEEIEDALAGPGRPAPARQLRSGPCARQRRDPGRRRSWPRSRSQ